MSFSNADFFNAIVGMTFDNRGRWPSCLYNNGYQVTMVEPTIPIGQGVVNPEVLMCSDSLRSALSFEWKSGPNTKADQNARNAQLTGQYVGQFMAARNQLLGYTPTHTYVYACDDNFYNRFAIDLDAHAYPFPVLGFTAEEILLRRGTFDRNEVQNAFTPGVVARMKEAPRLLRFDFSSDDRTIAFELLRYVQLRMTQERVLPEDPDEETSSMGDVLQEINPYLNENLADEAREEFCSRIKRLLTTMARQSFRKYIQVHGDEVTVKLDCFNYHDFQVRAVNFLGEVPAA